MVACFPSYFQQRYLTWISCKNDDHKIASSFRCVESALPKTLALGDPQDGISRLDNLVSELCFDKLGSSLWRTTALYIAVTYAATLLHLPISVLIVSTEAEVVSKMASMLDNVTFYSHLGELEVSEKGYSSKHVEGRRFTVCSAGQLSQHNTLLYFEHFEILRPSELKTILSSPRSPHILACCSPSFAANNAQILSNFDLICVHDATPTLIEELELTELVLQWHSSKTFGKLKISVDPERKHSIPANCESILREYFVASRTVIGEQNSSAPYPIYDPVSQLQLGKTLTSVMQKLRFGLEACRTDVLLSIAVQELNLKHRLGSAVFKRVQQAAVPCPMPSPCPSVVPSIHGSTYRVPTNFTERYSDLLESIMERLKVSLQS